MKLIKYFIQALFIYFFYFFAKLIGIKMSRKIFSYLFFYVGRLFRSKKIVEKNLKFFKDNISNEDKEKIISNMWKNYGKTFIEYAFLDKLKNDNSHITISGENIIQQVIADNKPVIFVSGHFANFELMSMEITKRNVQLATIYRPLNNYFLNPYMEYLRKKYICKNQIKKGINGVRQAIKFLNDGCSLAMMIDQRVSEGEKIDFFGKSALTSTLTAQLAIKFDLKIVPVFIERKSNNNFRIEFLNQIKASDFKNKIDLTIKLNKILEEMITRNPTQWIWTHNRWK